MSSFAQDWSDWLETQLRGGGNPASSAQEIAAGIIDRCFASASIEGRHARLFPKRVASKMARELVVDGETVWINQATRLQWVNNYTIDRGQYSIDGRNRRAQSVLHVRYDEDMLTGRGISPLRGSPQFKRLLEGLEKALKDESQLPGGYAVPTPTTDESTKKSITERLKSYFAGNFAVTGFQKSGESLDLGRFRLGPELLEPNVGAYELIIRTALGILGVPIGLISQDSSGLREGMRHYHFTTLLPYSDKITDAAKEIGIDVSFNFDRLMASDIQGRARAYRSLVGNDPDGNLDSDEALALIGVTDGL